MQRKRKHIFRKDRQNFPNLHKIIRIAKEEINFKDLNTNEIKKKLVTDEMNQINFYDIVIPKVTGIIDSFHSLHNSTEANAFKSIKINSGISYSKDQMQVRKDLKKQPGGLMLLREMYNICYLRYKNLEEDPEEMIQHSQTQRENKHTNSMPDLLESDIDAVANLDNWRKEKMQDLSKLKKKDINLIMKSTKRLSVISQISKIVQISIISEKG